VTEFNPAAELTFARPRDEALGLTITDLLVVDRLDELGIATQRIRLSGGGARSRVWAQIRADASGRPVEIADAADASPIGAAILAATAIGLSTSVQEAAERLAGRIETIDPNPVAGEIYDRSYRRYRTLFDALAPLH
jgi:xylulokinase